MLPCSQLPASDPWGHRLSRLTDSKWPGMSLRVSPSTARASLLEGATEEQPWLSAGAGAAVVPERGNEGRARNKAWAGVADSSRRTPLPA